MKKFILLFLLISLVNLVSLAQTPELSFGPDSPVTLLNTIKVFNNDLFNIKDKLSDWSGNFAEINYTIGIYTEIEESEHKKVSFKNNIGGLEYKRGKLKYYKSDLVKLKSNVVPGVNSGDYEIQISINISSPGTYYFVGTIKGKSELGNYFEEAGYWVVNCIPHAQNKLINNVSLKSEYRFGETVSFDFGISGSEMDKLSKYNFKIFDDQKELFSGNGTCVNLDLITKNPSFVNKLFRIEGYYNDSIIKFFNPQLNKIDSTVWVFRLLPPDNFVVSSNWLSKKEFNNLGKDDVIDALDMSEDKNLKFKFIYYSLTGDGAIITKPGFNNLLITSSPRQFLINSQNNSNILDEGIWKVIELNVNKKFLRGIPENSTKKVTLTIKFTTQFGEQKEFAFVGFIF